MKKLPLLAWILIAIVAGVLLGALTPRLLAALNGLVGSQVPTDSLVRALVTFNTVFSAMLNFTIPLIIIGFIVPGIGSLERGAGKMLGTAVSLSYGSSVLAGLVALGASMLLFPTLLAGQQLVGFDNPEEALTKGYMAFDLEPVISVVGALVLAFILGLGISALKSERLLGIFNDFQAIMEGLLGRVIIPLLPLHIMGVFANMTLAGQVQQILVVFGKVFVMIVLLHWTMLLLQYSIAGSIVRRNPLAILKHMLPAYFTAMGTQSSAATIPVTLRCAKKAGINPKVADFAIPLCATIHLSGSMITITSCSVAVLMMTTGLPTLGQMLPFILVLAVMMVAAPGVPGGAVMTALGVLQSMLGFDGAMVALMIALYLAQDSFGTATNVTGDASIALLTDALSGPERGEEPTPSPAAQG